MALDQTKVVNTLEDDLQTVARLATEQAGKIMQRLFLLAAQMAAGDQPLTTLPRFRVALAEIVDITVRSMGFSDMLGRLRTIREAKAEGLEVSRTDLFTRDVSVRYQKINTELPDFLKLPFLEAVEDFAEREPALVDTAQEVHDAYRRREFTLARATSLQVVEKAQRQLNKTLTDGGTATDFVKFMRKSGAANLSEGYLKTVFRTNLSTAQHAGRVRMAEDPDFEGFLLGWRYVAQVSNPNKPRPTHAAMHNHIAALNDPVWLVWTPPNGFNCRCTIIEVSKFGAKDLGRIKRDGSFRSDPAPSVLPDTGFAGSPRGAVYG